MSVRSKGIIYDGIDYQGHPKSKMDDLLKKYSKVYLVLEDVLANKNVYRILYQDILDIMKYGYEFEKIRHKILKFKIHTDDKKIHELPMNLFLANMVLWRSFVDMDSIDAMKEEHIFEFRMCTRDKIKDYIDYKILPICNLDFHGMNKMVDDINYHMRAISTSFSILFGLGMSVYDIIQVANRNPEVEEILHHKIDSNMQPIEIEAELIKRTDRLIEIFSYTDTDNNLRPLFLSGKNLSKAQFKEITVMIGLKADVNGNTIPHLIDCNILVDGINTPSAYYIDAMSGRKSLILSKTRMGEPGSFSKKVTNNTISAVLRKDYEECNSIPLVEYYISDEEVLETLDKRYYFDITDGKLHLLNFMEDTHLIGRVLGFKSPITCLSTEGICHICYGELFDINKDLFSVGAFAGIKDTEPLGQTILGSKHSQVTKSTLIQLCAEAEGVFDLTSNEITISATFDEDLYMSFPDLEIEDLGDEVYYYASNINVMDKKGNTSFVLKEENGSKFFLPEEMKALLKQCKDGIIPLSYFDDDTSVLFEIQIKNRELGKSLEDMEKLLNTNAHAGCTTYSQMAQAMLELCLESGIHYNAVHHELIIRQLMRKKSNRLERPDFSPSGNPDDYVILRLDEALTKNPAPMVSLISNYLKKQLVSPDLYKKTSKSHLDPMFIADISNTREAGTD